MLSGISRPSLPSLSYDLSVLVDFFLYPYSLTVFCLFVVCLFLNKAQLWVLQFKISHLWRKCWITKQNKNKNQTTVRLSEILNAGKFDRSCGIAHCQMWGCMNGGEGFELLPCLSTSHLSLTHLTLSQCAVSIQEAQSLVDLSLSSMSLMGSRLWLRNWNSPLGSPHGRLWNLRPYIHLHSTRHLWKFPISPSEPCFPQHALTTFTANRVSCCLFLALLYPLKNTATAKLL